MMLPVSDARSIPQQPLKSSFPLKLTIWDQHVVMDNGLVKVTLSAPGGMVTGIEYKGIDNLLDLHQKESRRGYWDIVWERPEKVRGKFEPIEGTSFKVIAEDEYKIELSFRKHYYPSADLDGTALPLSIDKRFIMLRGQSGLYSYAIFERLEGWPELEIDELRLAFKLHEELFNYMAVSDTMQRPMPTNYDHEKGRVLDYKEAILRVKEEVDDK